MYFGLQWGIIGLFFSFKRAYEGAALAFVFSSYCVP